jgi:hypothetical protein
LNTAAAGRARLAARLPRRRSCQKKVRRVDGSKSARAFALGYLAETHGPPKLLITYARYRTDESVSRGQYESMMNTKRIPNSTFLLGLIGLVVAAVDNLAFRS